MSEAKDVAGYRVYRSDFYIDDWKLLKDIKIESFPDDKGQPVALPLGKK